MPDKCPDCIKTSSRHKKDPSKPYHCHKHHCPYETARGQQCGDHKKAKDDFCSTHNVTPPPPPPPPCSDERCQRPKAGPAAAFCKIHSCFFKGCMKGARPGDGKDYCDTHKCDETRCQFPRKPILRGDQILFATFCRFHECKRDGCPAKILPNKYYCIEHACNHEDCEDERDGRLDVCLKHHDDYTYQNVSQQERSKWEREQEERARLARAKEEREREQKDRLREQIAREEREKLEKEQREEQERKARAKRERDRKRASNGSAQSSNANFGDSDSDEAYSSASPKATGSRYYEKKPARKEKTYLRPEDGRERNQRYAQESTYEYASSGPGRKRQSRYHRPEVVDDYDELKPRGEFRGPLPTRERERPVPVGRDEYGRPIVVQEDAYPEEQDMYGRPPLNPNPRRTGYYS